MLFQYAYYDKVTKIFCEEEKYLELFEWGREGEHFFNEIEPSNPKFKEKTIYRTFCASDPKILINYHRDIYHCIIDILGTVLYEYQKNKDTLFLFHIPVFDSNFFKESYNLFLFNTLNKLKIKYEVLNPPSNNIIHISNFNTYYKYLPLMYDTVVLIEKLAEEFYKKSKPTKKVYVSRKKITRNKSQQYLFGDVDPSTLLFTDDNRLDDPEAMEKFFSQLGFEIIYPEDFGSYEEQIKYFTDVRMLAGVTTAGLLNAVYMPRGGTVIELSTPLLGNGRESIHNFYKEISFAKQHKYLSLTNFRNSKIIIDFIKKDKSLVKWLND